MGLSSLKSAFSITCLLVKRTFFFFFSLICIHLNIGSGQLFCEVLSTEFWSWEQQLCCGSVPYNMHGRVLLLILRVYCWVNFLNSDRSLWTRGLQPNPYILKVFSTWGIIGCWSNSAMHSRDLKSTELLSDSFWVQPQTCFSYLRSAPSLLFANAKEAGHGKQNDTF